MIDDKTPELADDELQDIAEEEDAERVEGDVTKIDGLPYYNTH